MQSITYSLVTYTLLATGLGFCLYLFVTLKREIHRIAQDSSTQRESLERAVSQLRAELSALNAQYTEIEKSVGQLPQVSSIRPGINTSRRSQVLRLHRRGERAEHISAVLGIPQGEVDLLLKVHRDALVA